MSQSQSQIVGGPVTSQSDNLVKKSVIVNAPIQHAFDVFTRRLDLWWPRTHRIGKVEMKEAVLEGREGGRWFERGVDGSECEWGRVLVWEPPVRVALSWHIDASWSYEPDPTRASRVEVTFTDEGNGRTRVELTHSELERHLGWENVRDAVASPGGWPGMLEMFATKAAEAERYSS